MNKEKVYELYIWLAGKVSKKYISLCLIYKGFFNAGERDRVRKVKGAWELGEAK